MNLVDRYKCLFISVDNFFWGAETDIHIYIYVYIVTAVFTRTRGERFRGMSIEKNVFKVLSIYISLRVESVEFRGISQKENVHVYEQD